jgi:hypothetical protein
LLTFHLLTEDGQAKTFGLNESDVWAGPGVALQAAILLSLRDYPGRTVVSTNKVMKKVRLLLAECDTCDQELVRLIREAALLLGLTPVFDPGLSEADPVVPPPAD